MPQFRLYLNSIQIVAEVFGGSTRKLGFVTVLWMYHHHYRGLRREARLCHCFNTTVETVTRGRMLHTIGVHEEIGVCFCGKWLKLNHLPFLGLCLLMQISIESPTIWRAARIGHPTPATASGTTPGSWLFLVIGAPAVQSSTPNGLQLIQLPGGSLGHLPMNR